MRHLIFIFVVIFTFSFGVFAGVADLSYQAEEGGFLYGTDFEYSKLSYSTKAQSSVIRREFDVVGISNSHRFSYGITEEIAAGLGLSYNFKETAENTKVSDNSAKVKDRNDKGLNDITIFGDWQFHKNFGTTLDFNIALGDGEDADSDTTYASKDGNESTGGHSVELTGNYTHFFTPEMEFFGKAGFLLSFPQTIKDLAYTGSPEGVYEFDTSVDFGIDLKVQYKISDPFFLGAGFEYAFITEDKGDYTVSGVKQKITIDSFSLFSFSLFSKYLFSEKFFAELGFSMDFAGDTMITTKDTAGVVQEKTDYKDIQEMQIWAGIGFAF